jgi:predicted aldo/keto reductase-like oxidoreductase
MSENKKREAMVDRRQFLGSGVAVTVAAVGQAAAAPGQAAKAKTEHPYNERTHKAMPTRNLGKTGYQVGIFSLGGQATLEIPGKAKESEAIVNRAIDLGINYIDTAAAYGDGTSETHIGQVIKNRRREVFLASKTNRRGYDDSMRLLERSLKNLQTDHLDLWQLHNVQRQDEVEQIFANDGAIKALEKARAEGVVRFLGITGHFEPIVLAEAIKRYPFDTILMAVNAADVHYLSFIKYLLPEAQRRGMGIIGMKLATRGRMLSSWTPPALDQQPERLRTPLKGTITMKESLYYNCSLPVSTNIVGVDDVQQLEENVKWASQFSPLCEAEMRELEYRTLPIVRQGLYFRRWNMPT